MVLEREKKNVSLKSPELKCQKAWALMDFCVFSGAVRLRHTAPVAKIT